MTGFLSRLEPPRPPSSSGAGPKAVTQAYADTALRNAVSEMSLCTEGGRNDKLNILAYGMRPFINGGLLDETYVEDALTQAARMAGLDDVEIRKTIQSGFLGSDSDPGQVSYVLEEPRNPSLVQPPSGPRELTPTAQQGDLLDVWGDLPPIDAANWMFDADDTQTIIWGEGEDILWAEGEALMIAGGMGLGKTTLAGRLVRGLLGLESEVLSLPVNPVEKPILYLAMDRPRQIRRSFRRQFKDDERDRIAGKLIIRPGPPIADIAQMPLLMLKMAQAAGAGTVIVDSLKDAAVGLAEDAVGAGYNRARQACLAAGVQVCELHHNRKATADSTGGIGEVFGSTWLTAGAGSVIMLTGEPGDLVVRFRHAKVPANEVGPWRLHHNPEDGVFEVQKIDLLVVVKNAGPNGVTAKDAAAKMYEKSNPTEAQCKKAQRQLDRLVNQGLLTRVEGHRGGSGGSAPASWFLAPSLSPQEHTF